mgnify:FL=1|tara:strand:- start:40 stop:615 length:576 start_codon:yes stop_codon:yes gene_type:complete
MAIPLYGQNKAGEALKSAANSVGYKEITVVTAGDASHTLSESDAGVIFINCALASAAVIKLPQAKESNIGLRYRILFGGTMAAACSIELPNAYSNVFAGVITQERCGNASGVAEHATAVRMTTIVTKQSDGEKALELDENDVTFGGAIGTDLQFEYASADVVIVSGKSYVNVATSALDGLQATSFTATGWS